MHTMEKKGEVKGRGGGGEKGSPPQEPYSNDAHTLWLCNYEFSLSKEGSGEP